MARASAGCRGRRVPRPRVGFVRGDGALRRGGRRLGRRRVRRSRRLRLGQDASPRGAGVHRRGGGRRAPRGVLRRARLRGADVDHDRDPRAPGGDHVLLRPLPVVHVFRHHGARAVLREAAQPRLAQAGNRAGGRRRRRRLELQRIGGRARRGRVARSARRHASAGPLRSSRPRAQRRRIRR